LQGRSPNKRLTKKFVQCNKKTNRRENGNGKGKKRTEEKDREIKKPARSPGKI
jgi:hypothetical protein